MSSFSSWIAGRRRRARPELRTAEGAQSLRVLYLFPEAYINAPWAVVNMILQHAAGNGIEPLVVFGNHTGGPVDFAGMDIPVLRMEFQKRSRGSTVRELRELVFAREIDLIHVVDSGPSLIFGTLLSLASRTPLVIHFHSIPRLWSPKKRIVLKAISNVAGAIVGVSEFVRTGIEQYIGIRPSLLTCVPNGVDVSRFTPEVDGTAMRRALGFKEGSIAVIEPARFWLLKGQKDLVRAAAIARKQNPAIEVALIGWDDTTNTAAGYRSEIEELIASLGLKDVVRCYEPSARAQEIHAAADIVCLPSIDEPFGLVAIEAQASGRAFLGAASGALTEIVEDGVDGVLAAPNAPEKLAEALVRLAADAPLRAALGARGRVRACRDFDKALLAKRFVAIYRAVLAGSALP
ncbi:MAG TPA: glycosyltransferase family 4 protein [Polyangiaceae bacterium]|nr:glycosyltransferase family 4 protein [Polyangiaceae bacterium]